MNFLQMLGLGGSAPQPTGNLPPDLLQGIDTQQPQQVNAIQGINPADVTADAAPLPPQAAPLPRRSILDTIGRISDVLANTGGAQAQYQPTLDARQAHELALGDHSRQVDLDKLKLALEGQKVQTGQSSLVQQAARRLQSIVTANPNDATGAISRAWPILAAQAGLDPQKANEMAQQFSANPGMIAALALPDAGDTKAFGVPIYSQDAQGNLHVHQLSSDGTNPIPAGETLLDPLHFLNLGNQQVGVGTHSGVAVGTPLQNTEAPGAAENRAQRDKLNAADIASREKIAGMPARTAGNKAGSGGLASNANALLSELSGIYDKLDKAGDLVNPEHGTGSNILARARASGIGQMLEGTVGTNAQTLRDRVNSIRPALMQSLAKATGMTGKQLDSNADVKLFMQTITDPTTSYPANKAAIAGLQRFLSANTKPDTSTRNLPPRITLSSKPVGLVAGGSLHPIGNGNYVWKPAK